MSAGGIGEPTSASPLRGRQAEIQTLRDRLDAVRVGRGTTVLVSGLAGMGKTVLLDASELMARERGISVFRGLCDVAGQVIPLGPLLQALVYAADAPADPAALRDLSQSPDQRFWLLRELEDALERAALRAPVLIVVDDVQWADEATLAALGTLTRQLATHRILWLLASRSAELSGPAGTTLSKLEAAGATKLTLGSLDDAAVAEVAADLLGGVPEPGLLRVLGRVQGHPFMLTELLRGMREENLVEVADRSARLTSTRTPLRFIDSINDQLARLSESAREAMQMASVLGRRFSAAELANLTGRSPAAVFGALREAMAAGLVTEDGDRVAFRHDLVRDAVDATLPKTARQSLRRQAVDVMLRHGAPPADVAELVMDVARPGDTEAITILRRAAAETGRVSPAVASVLSRRALDLTPPGDPGRASLTTDTIAYLTLAGKAAEAVRLITAGSRDLSAPEAEAEARLRLALLLTQYALPDSVEQCRRALELPDLSVTLRIQLQVCLALALDLLGDVADAERATEAAADLARSSGDPADAVLPLFAQASLALARGRWRRSLDLLSEATARWRNVRNTLAMAFWELDAWIAIIDIRLARIDEGLALVDAGLQIVQQEGEALNIRNWLMIRCRTLYIAGRLADARSDAEAAIEMADEIIADGRAGQIDHQCRYIAGRVALHTGDPEGLDQARRTAELLLNARESPSAQSLGGLLLALVADAGADPALAAGIDVRLLDPLARGALATSRPQSYADCALLTRVLVNAGRHADAESVTANLERFAAQHPDFPFLGSAALHARALLEAEPDMALRAVACGDGDPRPLVRASVLEDAGRLLPATRAGEAVPLLESALTSYAEAGAERDAARVRSLLRARGVRPAGVGPRSAPQWPELTESEFAVVILVARGATNREVAERLYLSPYTVNTHLRHVFTKLDIHSRVELARIATERGIPADA